MPRKRSYYEVTKEVFIERDIDSVCYLDEDVWTEIYNRRNGDDGKSGREKWRVMTLTMRKCKAQFEIARHFNRKDPVTRRTVRHPVFVLKEPVTEHLNLAVLRDIINKAPEKFTFKYLRERAAIKDVELRATDKQILLDNFDLTYHSGFYMKRRPRGAGSPWDKIPIRSD